MSTEGRKTRTASGRPEEPESLAQLRGDCARMSSRWHRREDGAPPAHGRPEATVEPARPHGVDVPEHSAHLLDGMSDYGD